MNFVRREVRAEFFCLFFLVLLVLFSLSGEAAFKISYECLAPNCVEGETIVWKVNISNVERESIRVYKIEIKNFDGTIASYSEPFEVPFSQSRIVTFLGKVPAPYNFTTAYYYPCFTFFRIENKTVIPDEERCYNVVENLTVMPSRILRCSSDADCPSDSRCEQGLCFMIRCEGCTHAEEHKCVSYECCSNAECASRMVCKNHSCSLLNCPEDYYADEHICKKLSCGIFEVPRRNVCAPNYIMYISAAAAFLIILGISTIVFLKNFRVGGKTLWKKINDSREVKKYRMREQRYLKEAEIHRELLKYEKGREEIKFHTAEMKKYELLASKERSKWEKILGLQTCPECHAQVDAKLRICPKCGARLKDRSIREEDFIRGSQYER
ncbi:MAG: hypothetical protein QXW00_01865 [Candidatus Woesearchaeota archaeon]